MRPLWLRWVGLSVLAIVAVWLLLSSSPNLEPRIEIQAYSSSHGVSQMFFAKPGETFSEQRSRSQPMGRGENTLRFPFGLIKGTVGDSQRWDPSDRPAEFVVSKIQLRGLFMSEDVPLTQLRPALDVSGIALAPESAAFAAESNDPQMLLDVPISDFYFINLLHVFLTTCVLGLLTIAGVLLIRKMRRIHGAERGQTGIAAKNTNLDPERSVQLLLALRVTSVIVVAIFVTQFAWLSDDALITLRTSLNAVHGYGAVFNIDERVQAFTHPLWFLLVTAAGWATGEWILVPIVLGIVTTSIAVAIVAFRITSIARLIVFTSALLLSNAFVEYATSGLENGLAYLLIAGLLVGTLRTIRQPSAAWGIGVGILAGALLLTRLDLVLLILPLGIYLAVQLRGRPVALLGAAGSAAVLLLSWFSFSYLYYGAALPSTFGAKTNVDIPRTELVLAGFRYLGLTFIQDPVSLIILVAGFLFAFVAGSKFLKAVMGGVGLYLLYVIWIGGDFMAGRFVAVPVFMTISALVLERSYAFISLVPGAREHITDSRYIHRVTALGVIALTIPLVLAGWNRSEVLNPPSAQEDRGDFSYTGGVEDERAFSLDFDRGLWQYLGGLRAIDQLFSARGDVFTEANAPDLVELQAVARHWPSDVRTSRVIVQCGGLGARSILGGPSVHIIDPCGLTDPFLASIPYRSRDFEWRAGHFHREIPAGYVDAVAQRDANLLLDESLRESLIEIWSRTLR